MTATTIASGRGSQILEAVADAEIPGHSRRCLGRSDGEPQGESVKHFGVWDVGPGVGGDGTPKTPRGRGRGGGAQVLSSGVEAVAQPAGQVRGCEPRASHLLTSARKLRPLIGLGLWTGSFPHL